MKLKLIVQWFLINFSVLFYVVIFIYDGSINKYFSLKNEVLVASSEFKFLENEVNELKKELVCWQKDSNFMTEELARKELFMGFPDDILYVPTKNIEKI